MKHVWLNIETGEFSNSWSDLEEEELRELVDRDFDPKWKLIEYECKNDEEFKFNHMMRIA